MPVKSPAVTIVPYFDGLVTLGGNLKSFLLIKIGYNLDMNGSINRC